MIRNIVNQVAVVLLIASCSAAVADTTTYKGHVADDAGKPVAGASVRLIELAFSRVIPHNTVTALDGTFSVPGNTTGVNGCYYFVDAASYAVATGKVDANNDTPITLSHPKPLTGSVVDRAGAPVSGAIVRVWSIEGQDKQLILPLYFWGDQQIASLEATTDAQGRYTFPNAPVNGLYLFLDDKRFAAASVQVSIGQSTAPVLTAKPGSVISGRAIYADGRPASGWRVAAYSWAQDGQEKIDVPRWVKDDGSFELTGLYPGVYNVQLESGAALPVADADTWCAPSLTGVKVVSGGTTTAPLFTLSHGATLTGIVTDGDGGKPVAGVVVGAYTSSWSGGITGADGRYTLHVPPGTTAVEVNDTPDEYARYTKPLDRVAVTEGVVHEFPPIVLTNGLTLSGTVKAADGTPVGGVSITAVLVDSMVAPVPWIPPVTSAADGTFRIPKLTANRYRLETDKHYTVLSGANVAASSSPPVVVTVAARKLVDLPCQIDDGHGKPLPGVEVSFDVGIKNSEGISSQRVSLVSDASGNVIVKDISKDSIVSVSSKDIDGYQYARGGELVKNGDDISLSPVVFEATSSLLYGVVRDDKDALVPGAWVATSRGGAPVQADATGRFQCSNLAEGPIEIFASKGSDSGMKKSIVTGSKTVVVLPIDAAPQSSLSGFDRGRAMLVDLMGSLPADNNSNSRWNVFSIIAGTDTQLVAKFEQDVNTTPDDNAMNGMLLASVASGSDRGRIWALDQIKQMKDGQAKGQAAYEIGTLLVVRDPSSAAWLYDLAKRLLPIPSYNERTSYDACSLAAFASLLHKPEAADLQQGALAAVQDGIDKHKSDDPRQNSWRFTQYAQAICIGDMTQLPLMLKKVSSEQQWALMQAVLDRLKLIDPALVFKAYNLVDWAQVNNEDVRAYAFQSIVSQAVSIDPQKAIDTALAFGVSNYKAECLAAIADLLPLPKALPLYRQAADVLTASNSVRDGARIAAKVWGRDKALGAELFKKVLETGPNPYMMDDTYRLGGIAEQAFYYARCNPSYSRVQLEALWAQTATMPQDWQSNDLRRKITAAMAVIDVDRANDMAYTIKDDNSRYRAATVIAELTMASPEIRDRESFDDWVDNEGMVNGVAMY